MKRAFVSLLLALGVHGRLSAEQKDDLGTALTQAAPGATAAGATRLAGLPLSEWAVIASILFIVLQVAYLVWKWRRDARREDDRIKRLGPIDSLQGGLRCDE